MKNIIKLILLSYLLIINNLNAQIDITSEDFAAINPQIGPLSILDVKLQKFQISDTTSQKLEIQSPYSNNAFNDSNKEWVNNKGVNSNLQIIDNQSFADSPFIINNSTFYKNAFKPRMLATSNSKKFKLIDFFQAADTFDRKRFWGFVGASTTTYVGTVLLLDKVWYAQYDRSAFHLFDDRAEWLDMDKGGHVLTAYTETKWIYSAMRWTGMSRRKAAWAGMATGTMLQATLEVLDGFSTEWGFSWADMGANTAGCALFGIQQAVWDEQRLVLKVSNTPRSYSTAPIVSTDGSKTSSLQARTNDLYGTNYAQTFFKDYNALTWWLSINPKSFNKKSRFPSWLNIAVGYGADNMFGGYANDWPTKKPEFSASKTDFPRYRQFYLSLDIDLSKIKTKSKFINTIAKTINFIKIPAPTLEFNTLGKIKFHPLFF